MKEKTGKDYLSPESKKKLLRTFALKMTLALVLLAVAVFLTIYWNK